MVYVLGTHVRSLATHYDEGTEDLNGFTYSQRLAAKGIFRFVIPPLCPALVILPPSWQTMVCDVTAEYPMYMPTQDDR
jgi:hypothetical protein